MPFETMKNFSIINSTEEENKYIDSMTNVSYLQVIEMSIQDRHFLNSMILRNNPKKVLELGVSAGGSSVIILNAIKSFEKTKLYSIDYLKHWYKSPDKKAGYIVDNYPDFKSYWNLYTGGMVSKYISEIGNGIDFVLLDTMHMNPGEILDFLMVLPFLNDDAIIVFHDTKLHTSIPHGYNGWSLTNNLLMSSIYGDKYIPDYLATTGNWGETGTAHFPNIGAIKLNYETKHRLFEVINLLTIRWGYLPPENDKKEIIEFLTKYYEKSLIEYVKIVFDFQYTFFEKFKEKEEDFFYTQCKYKDKEEVLLNIQNKYKEKEEELLYIQSKYKEKVEDIDHIYNSYTYRIGRIMTWLPRKVRGIFRKIIS